MRVEKGKTYTITGRRERGQRLTAIVVTRGGALLVNERGVRFRIFEDGTLCSVQQGDTGVYRIGKAHKVLQESNEQ